MTEKKTNKISVATKLWLGSADGLVGTLCGMITGGGMTYYFTKYMGLKASYASIVWLIFGIWNAINDPLFGYISDRTKSEIGRRIPYIRYGAPFYSLIFIISWVAFPWQGNQTAMFIQMLVTLFLFDALYTAIATALYVMPYEMTVDNRERGSIMTYKVFFNLFSLAFPLVVMPLVQPDPGTDATMFRIIMTAIGIFAGIVIFFSTFFYKENHYTQEEEQPPFLTAIVNCFKNRAFLVYEVISFTIIYLQTALMQGILYYFAEFDIPMAVCYAALGVGAVLGMIIFIRLQEKVGLSTLVSIMCGLFAIGCLLMAFFGDNLIVAICTFFSAGVGFAGGMYLVPLMSGDVIDSDELKTGLRREGMYAGVNSFITKPAISIAQSVFLTIITAYGYVQDAAQGTQSEIAKQGILIGWMIVPAGLLILCFVCMFAYPLKGKEWKAKKEELIKLHEKKNA